MGARIDTTDILRFNGVLARLSPLIGQAIDKRCAKSASNFQKRGKRIAPRSNDAPHIGDSLTVSGGDRRLFEWVVKVTGQPDAYDVPLEFGHRAADGSHVPANPWFVPLTRVINKQHMQGLRRDTRKILRQVFPR